MKYFLDTEFIERGPLFPVTLISIGIVAEDGREYYAISSEFDAADASEWVQANVINHLESEEDVPAQSTHQIAEGVHAFVGDDPKPEFWGYYADYDWVVFAQLFGTMTDLPKGFPMYCRDIKQLCDDHGNPKLPEQGKGEHNALADARWNKIALEFLQAESLDQDLIRQMVHFFERSGDAGVYRNFPKWAEELKQILPGFCPD